MRFVAPFGFYGAGNIGDEATLQGFARLLAAWGQVAGTWVASRDPLHTSRVEPSFRYYEAVGRDLRRWWAKYRSDAFVFPGGTPIMDALGRWPLCEIVPIVEAAAHRRKPVGFLGTGTETLGRDESRRLFADDIAPRVRHWSVRCARDKERLANYGVADERITVAADMAWLLDATSLDFGRVQLRKLGLNPDDSMIGVNVNSESFMVTEQPRLFAIMANFLDAVIGQYDVRVLFLCNEVREGDSFDKAASLKIKASMVNADKTFFLPNEYWTPQQMMSVIGCCGTTISTRYHVCLFSALQDIPFLALQRSDKVADLSWDLEWIYGIALSDLDDSKLIEMFSDLQKRRDVLTTALHQRTREMHDRALLNQRTLDSMSSEAWH